MEFENLRMIVIQLLIFLISPPFFLGVIAKVKALFAGRAGPPIFQPYYDLVKLFRKGSVYSRVSSPLLKMAPAVILAAILTAGLFLPFFGKAPLHFEGDIILFAYLLALGRFWILLASLNVGSSFGGMGASREAAFGALSELAFFMGLIVLVTMTHSLSLDAIFQSRLPQNGWQPVFLLLSFTFFLILLTENSRLPIDDPATHLELTMIHEVMILDYSGVDLGLILYGASVKLFLFMAVVISLLWPPEAVFTVAATALFFLKITMVACTIGIVEASVARLRLIKIPQLLVANFVIALFTLLVALSTRGAS